MKRFVTHNEVLELAGEIKELINLHFGSGRKKLTVFPVPRGGIPVAYVLSAISSHKLTVTDDPAMADFIIDDLVDSGATRQRYEHFNKPFWVLIDKQATEVTDWLVFPWEVGDGDQSADDIPTRLLQYIGEDSDRGGLKETPKRFLKAWKYYTSGYDRDAISLMKVFEDGAENCDAMVVELNIPVFSHCEHHLAPFYGVAHVAYIPNPESKRVLGLSKFVRVVDVFMRRLQVQERLTAQIANAFNDGLKPLGVAVMLDCSHTCMIGRGVKIQGATTITSSMLGVFRDDASTRNEFLHYVANHK